MFPKNQAPQRREYWWRPAVTSSSLTFVGSLRGSILRSKKQKIVVSADEDSDIPLLEMFGKGDTSDLVEPVTSENTAANQMYLDDSLSLRMLN